MFRCWRPTRGRRWRRGCPTFAGGGFLIDRNIVLGLGSYNFRCWRPTRGRRWRRGFLTFAGGGFLIDRKIMLGLGSYNFRCWRHTRGRRWRRGCLTFTWGWFLIDGKIVLGLGNSDVQVLTAYPGKEVKKGLTDLYRKVEKHLSEDENLLQVQEWIKSINNPFFPNSSLTRYYFWPLNHLNRWVQISLSFAVPRKRQMSAGKIIYCAYQCCGSGMFIPFFVPDPDFFHQSWVSDSGSSKKRGER